MALYCTNCGAALTSGSAFCEHCGSRVTAPPEAADSGRGQTPDATNTPPEYAGNGRTRIGIPAPGFSDRVNDPEILAFLAKNRKTGRKVGFVVALLPLIGFVIYAAVTEKMELPQAALYGAVVSAVFFLVQFIAARRERPENSYEGVVTDKETRISHRSNTAGNRESREYEYVIHVQTTEGKKKKIVEHEGSRIIAYRLLNKGDRFRYHANFAFPYELYDKTKGPGIYCVGCQTLNPTERDRCKKCGIPLLK